MSFAAETQHVECHQVLCQNLHQPTVVSVSMNLEVLIPISEPSFSHVFGPLQGRLAAQVSQLNTIQLDPQSTLIGDITTQN